jgi:miniconductance mechanosensitive channel
VTTSELQTWIEANPGLGFSAVILISIVLFFIARAIIARGLTYLAKRTETKVDDIIVNQLRPYRVALLAPLLVIFSFAYLLPDFELFIERTALFIILWVVAFTLNSLLEAANTIYEQSPSFTGVSIQGYLDIVKLLVILVALILSISIFIGESPLVLLSGLGALTAVLLLIFRDTILSLVASIQISTQNLIKEGDWIEVPSYGADGDVINMTLHTIKVQNFDKTITVIPTYKMIEVGYKNWRGMQESGGRRIKRSIHIDLASIKFCDQEMIDRFKQFGLIRDYLDGKEKEIEQHNKERGLTSGDMVSGRQLTNVGTFRAYIEAYLRQIEGIHQEKMTFLVRQLAPSLTGLPLQIYVFTKSVAWTEYEHIQSDIFDHLLAAASYFDLSVFQQPTGMDFAVLANAVGSKTARP